MKTFFRSSGCSCGIATVEKVARPRPIALWDLKRLLAAGMSAAFCVWVRSVIVIVLTLRSWVCAVGSTPVINADLVALRSAVEAGGVVTLAFDGTVKLDESLTISKDTTVDASGHTVRLDGGNFVRHFVVINGATLRLVNLTLSNGRFKGSDGQADAPAGGDARGGSIYQTGGAIELIRCRFLNNQTRAGDSLWVGDVPLSEKLGGEAFGGAIYSSDGSVAATNCLFAGNQSLGGMGSEGFTSGDGGDAYGGALYLTNGLLNLDAVVFTNNVAQGGEFGGPDSFPKFPGGGGSGIGGALAIELRSDTLSNAITGCVFEHNRAAGATRTIRDLTRSHADGGALFLGSGSLSVSATFMSGNSALGGPGYSYSRNPTFGDGRGAAVYSAGELTIQNSAIVSNQAAGGSMPEWYDIFAGGAAGAGWGGAIFNRGILAVSNVTLAENTASGGAAYAQGRPGSSYGGGIYNERSVCLVNVTAGRNSAIPGMAGGFQSTPGTFGDSLATASGTVTLTNSILFSVSDQTNVWGAVIDGGHNISSDGSAHFTSPTSKNNVDPMLGPLANNGGLTPTMALLFGSPAIDAGDPAMCPPADQRGVPRPLGANCDIGAFEYSPTFTLTRWDTGAVRVTYQFYPGETNTVSFSTNLLNWELLGTGVTGETGSFELDDPGSKGTPSHFYRIER